MGSYTYPVARPEGTLTDEQIHMLLSRPRLLAKRLATLADQKFIADFLLSGRFVAAGGGIFYETGEEVFAADASEVVEPGSAYPKTVLTAGEIAAAKTGKRGIGTDITDEKISREGASYVNRALTRLSNTVIRDVDQVAMAVVASKVTSTVAASATWATPGAALETLITVQGQRAEGTGINLSTVVLKPAQFAKFVGMLVDKNALPRENGNIVLSGNLPVEALGFTWVTSPHVTGSNPLLIDRDLLGGVADENITSPEFVSAAGSNVQVASDRAKGRDAYELRARRVCVPVVTDPNAGVAITGTGL